LKELRIQHMVCPRCVEAVEDGLRRHGLEWDSVELGRVKLRREPEHDSLEDFSRYISSKGFELIQERGNALVSDIKSSLIRYLESIENGEDYGKISDWLSSSLHKNYSYLSDSFSKSSGQTIESYFIKLRVERAKELLESDELSIGEVAHRLGYSSSQHFSAQFSGTTGAAPGKWRKNPGNRKSLDSI